MQIQKLNYRYFSDLEDAYAKTRKNLWNIVRPEVIIDREFRRKQIRSNPKVCPFCSGVNIKKGIKLETDNTVLRDYCYIEYFCIDCQSYFLV